MEKALRYFKEFLREKTFRLTKQREAIAAMFLVKEGHICTDELYYLVRKKHPRVGYSTVYRTIKLLKNARMAAEVNFIGKRKKFEHLFEHPHHDHFICDECGKVIEFIDPQIEARREALCRKYKFKGKRHLTQIFGICRSCQKKGA